MKPETVLDAYQLFLDSPECRQNPKVVNNLKTAFRKFLQTHAFQPEDVKREKLESCLQRIALNDLKDAEARLESALQEAIESGQKLSDGSIRNYRSAFKRFLSWLEQQPWYLIPLKSKYTDRAPNLSVRKSPAHCAEDKRQREEILQFLEFNNLQELTIQPGQLNAALQTQLDEFEQFWTTDTISLRKGPPMQIQAIQRSLQGICFRLGWLMQHRQMPAEELTLEALTNLSDLQDCLNWAMKEREKDHCWASDIVKVSILVTKFLNPQAKHYDHRDIPTVKAMRSYLHEVDRQRKDVGLYSLRSEQFTDSLRQDLERFEHFWLDTEVPERKGIAIVKQTFKNYHDCLLGILGWQHNVKGVPIDKIAVANAADITVLKSCIAHLINNRKFGYGRAVGFGYAALAVAKWLHPESKRHDFRDIEQVEELRDYVRYLRQQNRHEGRRHNLDNQRLTFQEAQQVVEYLKQACAPLDKYGDDRSFKAIMSSWQQYLVVAILTYCPVRQREIRELELNSTLFREADCYWVKLKPTQHKAGRRSRKGREYPLPKHLTEDLDHWLQNFRPKVSTAHNLVFIKMGSNRNPATRGEPLNGGNMSDLVTAAVHRATAVLFDEPRDTTPHVYRRIAITYQRRYGRPEQRDAFAEMLGHSVKEADATYNEETLREKSQAAEDWWKLNPQEKPNNSDPQAPLPQGWVADDKQELSHLGLSSYQNNYLRKVRDQALLTLWAMHELSWAELHRLNVGCLSQQDEEYQLAVLKPNEEIGRVIPLRTKIGRILQTHLDARKECGELLSPNSPLFIGIGNRSGGSRLAAASLVVVVQRYLGKVA